MVVVGCCDEAAELGSLVLVACCCDGCGAVTELGPTVSNVPTLETVPELVPSPVPTVELDTRSVDFDICEEGALGIVCAGLEDVVVEALNPSFA